MKTYTIPFILVKLAFLAHRKGYKRFAVSGGRGYTGLNLWKETNDHC